MKSTKTPRQESLDFSFTTINKHALDDEWVNQIAAVDYYGRKLAKAKLTYDQAKATSAVFEAETSRRVRSKPKNYSVTRLTEAAIKEAVMVEVLYSTEHDALLKAKHKVDLLEATMRTLEHRKKAISDLIFLHSQQYFSAPKLPKGVTNEVRTNNSRHKERAIRGLRDDN
jgi:hypothetical protein